jgi:hypothetical protein
MAYLSAFVQAAKVNSPRQCPAEDRVHAGIIKSWKSYKLKTDL